MLHTILGRGRRDRERLPPAQGRLRRRAPQGHHEARARGRAPRAGARPRSRLHPRAHDGLRRARRATSTRRRGRRSRRRPASPRPRSGGPRTSTSARRARSSAGPWGSRSSGTRSTTSSRARTSRSCAATSAGPARASARSAATRTCRATGRWASTTRRPRPSSTRSSATFGVPGAAPARATTSSRRSARWRAGQVDVFVAMGGNLAAAAPDTELTRAALARVGLTVHVATKLNRSHLVCGEEAMIWPALARSEADVQASGPQCVTVEDSMSCVHASQRRNPPASPHLRSEPAIVAGLAKAALAARADARLGRARRRLRPHPRPDRGHDPGFRAATTTRIAKAGGFVLPHAARAPRVADARPARPSSAWWPLRGSSSGRASSGSSRSARTTSTTRRSTATTTATAASAASGASSS